MLKTAFVIDDLGFGGAQRQLSILARALSRVAQPLVFSLSETTRPFGDELRDDGVEVISIPRSHGFDLRRMGYLARGLEEREIDVVHGFLDAANVYAWGAARCLGRPCVLSLRNERLRLGGLRRWVLSQALRRADFVVANSKTGRRFLIDRLSIPRERVAVIPNAVTVTSMTSPRPASHPPVIGYVGRLDPQKQVDILVNAFTLVLESLPEASLSIVGAGPEQERLSDLVRKRGIEGQVHFKGLVENVEDTMADFACLALPSAYEGFPNVAIEAVAMGVPVVAAPVGDVADIVLDGQTGYLMTERSPRALADLLVRAASDQALRQRVGQEGPALARRNHSVEAAVERLLPVYQKLTGK